MNGFEVCRDAAGRRRLDADPRAHGQDRRVGRGRGARHRRRRLPVQAVLVRRARGPAAGAGAARARRRGRRCSAPAPSCSIRSPTPCHRRGVEVHLTPREFGVLGSAAAARRRRRLEAGDPRRGVGSRLRRRPQHRGGLRALPPAQDRRCRSGSTRSRPSATSATGWCPMLRNTFARLPHRAGAHHRSSPRAHRRGPDRGGRAARRRRCERPPARTRSAPTPQRRRRPRSPVAVQAGAAVRPGGGRSPACSGHAASYIVGQHRRRARRQRRARRRPGSPAFGPLPDAQHRSRRAPFEVTPAARVDGAGRRRCNGRRGVAARRRAAVGDASSRSCCGSASRCSSCSSGCWRGCSSAGR